MSNYITKFVFIRDLPNDYSITSMSAPEVVKQKNYALNHVIFC